MYSGFSSSPATTGAKALWFLRGWKPPVLRARVWWIRLGRAGAACRRNYTSHPIGSTTPVRHLWRRQRETVTFEADLDDSPNFHLEISRHRWLTQKPKEISNPNRNWTVARPGPVVLTTRTEWTHELTPLVNTLMTSRGHNLLTVRFRPDSPNLSATIPLDALSGEETTASFLRVLRDLAAGSSASRQ